MPSVIRIVVPYDILYLIIADPLIKCCYRLKHDSCLSKKKESFYYVKHGLHYTLKGFEVRQCVIVVVDVLRACLLKKRIKDYFLRTLFRKSEIKSVMCHSGPHPTSVTLTAVFIFAATFFP